MIHTLALNPTHLSLVRPCMLFAQSCLLLRRKGLIVLQSIGVRDTDEVFSDVRDFIRDQKLRLVRRGIFLDLDMMLDGEGEISIYIEPARGDLVDPMLIESLKSEAIKFAERMVGATN